MALQRSGSVCFMRLSWNNADIGTLMQHNMKSAEKRCKTICMEERLEKTTVNTCGCEELHKPLLIVVAVDCEL